MSQSIQPLSDESQKPFVLARKRALMACLACRRRRVRCNAINGYDNPCERCQRRTLTCEYISVAEESQRAASESPNLPPAGPPGSNTARGRKFEPTPPAPSSFSTTRGRCRARGGGPSHGDSYFDAGMHNVLYIGAESGFGPSGPSVVPQQQQQQFSAYGHGQGLGYGNEYTAYPQSEWNTPHAQPQQHQHQHQHHHQTFPIPTADSSTYFDAQHPSQSSYTLRMETNMYFQSGGCTCRRPEGSCVCGFERGYY